MASTTLGPPALDRRAARAGALAAGAMLLGAMSLLAVVEELTGRDVFALPFVASAAVVAMAPRAPLARPAAVLIGYAASALVAAAVTAAADPSVWTATAAAVASLVTMLLLAAPHAPAAVCAAFIGLTGPDLLHPLHTVLPAVLVVLGTALLAGRLLPPYGYPPSWR
ncbi:HPP family protein [Micromonospora sp. NPDC047620]|uniref:HPP family protein n=1 Tax=Micromonospora sp. NPDC047620 TaxID=3364251 RepID=UPI003721E921